LCWCEDSPSKELNWEEQLERDEVVEWFVEDFCQGQSNDLNFDHLNGNLTHWDNSREGDATLGMAFDFVSSEWIHRHHYCYIVIQYYSVSIPPTHHQQYQHLHWQIGHLMMIDVFVWYYECRHSMM
jgi:hypothetical protein